MAPEALFVVEGVPDTGDGAPVLLPDGSICLPDRYQRVVLCRRPDASGWSTIGREGEGPGELKMPGLLARYPSQEPAIVVVDLELRRVSAFDLAGGFLGSAPSPYPFIPLTSGRSGGGAIAGLTPGPPVIGGPFIARVVTLTVPDGGSRDTVRIEAARSGGEGAGIGLGRGVVFPDGVMVFHVAGHRFARYAADGRPLGEFRYPEPLQEPIQPGSRDLEVYRRDVARIQGFPVSDAQLEERRRRPIGPLMGGVESMRAGPDSLLLAASARARDTHSFIDLFHRDGDYRGAIRVPGRLRGFDVLGDTLLVLVDRAPEARPEPSLELRGYRVDGSGAAAARTRSPSPPP